MFAEETMSKSERKRSLNWMPYIVCGLAAMFYLYEYVLQVSPSVMVPELMRDLNTNALGIGTIMAFYFFAYSPMQLPAGLLYDRFGPRKMITFAVIICSIGAFFFGMTPNLSLAAAGRFFIGMGSAFSFIGVLVLIANWFPARYFALLAGVAQAMSSLGAMIGKAPIAYWLSVSDWRNIMITLAIIGILLGLLIWFVVRDMPKGLNPHQVPHNVNMNNEMKRLMLVGRNSQTWAVAIYAFAIWAPIAVFATTWDVVFLKEIFPHLDTQTASSITSMIWLGIGIGSPLLGWWSDHIGKRCMPLSLSAALGLIVSILLLYFPQYLSVNMMYLIMFLFGAAASGQSACFGLVKDINHHGVVGTAVGLNNMAVLMGGVLFQPLVAQLLQSSWTGEIVNGVNHYTLANFQHALFVIPFCFALAWIASSFFMKETHCKPLYPYNGDGNVISH